MQSLLASSLPPLSSLVQDDGSRFHLLVLVLYKAILNQDAVLDLKHSDLPSIKLKIFDFAGVSW
jgi:hypothetical protein